MKHKTIQQIQQKKDALSWLFSVIEDLQSIPCILETDDQDKQKLDYMTEWLDLLHSRFSVQMSRDFQAWRKSEKI